MRMKLDHHYAEKTETSQASYIKWKDGVMKTTGQQSDCAHKVFLRPIRHAIIDRFEEKAITLDLVANKEISNNSPFAISRLGAGKANKFSRYDLPQQE